MEPLLELGEADDNTVSTPQSVYAGGADHWTTVSALGFPLVLDRRVVEHLRPGDDVTTAVVFPETAASQRRVTKAALLLLPLLLGGCGVACTVLLMALVESHFWWALVALFGLVAVASQLAQGFSLARIGYAVYTPARFSLMPMLVILVAVAAIAVLDHCGPQCVSLVARGVPVLCIAVAFLQIRAALMARGAAGDWLRATVLWRGILLLSAFDVLDTVDGGNVSIDARYFAFAAAAVAMLLRLPSGGVLAAPTWLPLDREASSLVHAFRDVFCGALLFALRTEAYASRDVNCSSFVFADLASLLAGLSALCRKPSSGRWSDYPLRWAVNALAVHVLFPAALLALIFGVLANRTAVAAIGGIAVAAIIILFAVVFSRQRKNTVSSSS